MLVDNENIPLAPNDLRLRILGNQEILKKCQMWVQTQPHSHSSFQKLNVDNSCQKARKIRYYVFEVLPNFIVSLYFVLNILSRIVDEKTFKTPKSTDKQAKSTLKLMQKVKRDQLDAFQRHLDIAEDLNLINFCRFKLTENPQKILTFWDFTIKMNRFL